MTTAFPGIVGFDDTVLPELETALLAGHDLVLLGERGQGKTRLMRTLTRLLDEWSPEVAGCEINDDPYAPVCVRCRRAGRRARRRPAGRLAAPRRPLHREAGHPGHQRRRPDRRRRPGQGRRGPHARRPGDRALRAGAAHQPRRLRAERAARPRRADPGGAVQRAGGARHPGPRLLAAAAAGPAAGRHRQPRGLHQPRPDHHPAQGPVRRRDPHPLPDRGRRRGGADPPGGRAGRRGGRPPAGGAGPVHRAACASRPRSTSAPVCRPGSRSPPPRRSPASALRRAARTDDAEAVARVGDLPAVLPTLLGKVEFEMGEEGREGEVLEHLLRIAVADDLPRPARRARPVRLHRAVRRGRRGRDRRAGAGRRAARPARHGPRAGQGARPARLRRRRPAAARSRPRSSSCSRGCT